jgi:hypothetical protein
VYVDPGVTLASNHTTLSGATLAIDGVQSGDSLHFVNQNGISGNYAGGVLTLTGGATLAQYQAALRSVTFTTSSNVKGSRTIDVIAEASTDAGNVASNTAAESVGVEIPAPVVTAHQSSVSATAGAAVAVDSAVTVTSSDSSVTGATVTIGTGLTAGDTLNFTSQNGITGSYASGVLTLSGTTTAANYQTAFRSVTFSNTLNNSLTTRHVTIAVSDSNDTGNMSGSDTTQNTLNAPITIIGAYVAGSAWTTSTYTPTNEQFDTYLVNHSLGDATVPAVGYALKTGASQTTDIPWININTISVAFSGPVSNIGLGSLKLVGGAGTGSVVAPSVTGFASDGNNTYSWTLSGSLGNNDYVFAVATTGSSFGAAGSTQVTDASGAGISGKFTTGSSTFPSGNGLANSTFDFSFSVLPADGAQGGTVNSSDAAGAKARANNTTASATYSPYYDYFGAGLINSADSAAAAANANKNQSSITAPAAPADSQQVGTTGGADFTALELGTQETGSSSAPLTTGSSPAATTSGVSNVSSASTGSASTASTSTPASTTSSSDTGTSSAGSTSTTTADDRYAAIDAALSDVDLLDVWA